MEDCCAVCAEPMQFTAYGPCGHKEACSRCVTRLRFVLKDKRCVICQQEHPTVFVTKYLGDYTLSLPAGAFQDFQARSSRRELQHLRAVDAYFDDEAHFSSIKHLCSYTHPDLAEVPDAPQEYRNLKDLKAALSQHLHRVFCNVCLDGRQVFLSEQVLYRTDQVRSHQQHGDSEGPLADAGFTGHPYCRFCKKFFYGENELFKHMSEKHESCFLCQRVKPNKHVYYRDYAELEEHFHHEHYLCEDPICRQEQFRVYATEAELKQHKAKEHGDSMSGYEKRQAMRIPIQMNYRRDEAGPSSTAGVPQGTTIGGSGGVRSRFRLREPNRQDHHQVANAIQASMESASAEAAQREAEQAQAQSQTGRDQRGFSTDDFPSVSGSTGGGAGPMSGRWAAAGGAPGGRIAPEDFPALPGTSKSAKRRAKEKQKTLAQRVGNDQVRVVNRAQPSRPTRDDFPDLSSSRAATPAAEPAAVAESSAAEETASEASFSADELPSNGAAPRQSHMPASSPSGQEAFPPLPGAAVATARQATPSGLQARPFLNPLAARAPAKGKSSRATAAKVGGQSQSAPKADDFPALGGMRPASASSSAAEASSSNPGGVSEALKAANKEVTDKVRRRLSPEDFILFKQKSALYMQGAAAASAFHSEVVSLGLASLLPDLAALCPDPAKRNALLEVHKQSFAQDSASKVSAHEAKSIRQQPGSEHVAKIEQQQGLSFNRSFDFVDQHITDCATSRGGKGGCPQKLLQQLLSKPPNSAVGPAQHAPSLMHPSHFRRASLPDGNNMPAQSASEQNGSNKKKGKAPKFERLRVTGGDAVATQKWLDTAGGQRTKPQNAWTQSRPAASNQWSSASVSEKERAARNAWSKS